MTIRPKNLIRSLIKHADSHSPIAVFRTGNGDKLDALFANTVHTQARIQGQDADLLGVFYGSEGVLRFRRMVEAV